jgi:hypothetical protein
MAIMIVRQPVFRVPSVEAAVYAARMARGCMRPCSGCLDAGRSGAAVAARAFTARRKLLKIIEYRAEASAI